MDVFSRSRREGGAPDDLIGTLRSLIDSALAPLLPRGAPVALLNFPTHGNVGDHAIWLGETRYLAEKGIDVVYLSDRFTYSRLRLARRIGRGAILLTGGGNLGDLYPQVDRFREEVITSFRTNKIIQLPQSIHFTDRGKLERARKIFDAHPDLSLVVRDHQSLDIAQRTFRCPSILCPDMAFWLGRLDPPIVPSRDAVWLLRGDEESAVADEVVASNNRIDWRPTTRDTAWRARYAASRSVGMLLPLMSRSAVHAYDKLSWHRLRAGLELLAHGRVVITDRLHGHILSLLLGRPHVVLDNSYGKLSAFYETWTKGCSISRWARSPAEAAMLAERHFGVKALPPLD